MLSIRFDYQCFAENFFLYVARLFISWRAYQNISLDRSSLVTLSFSFAVVQYILVDRRSIVYRRFAPYEISRPSLFLHLSTFSFLHALSLSLSRSLSLTYRTCSTCRKTKATLHVIFSRLVSFFSFLFLTVSRPLKILSFLDSSIAKPSNDSHPPFQPSISFRSSEHPLNRRQKSRCLVQSIRFLRSSPRIFEFLLVPRNWLVDSTRHGGRHAGTNVEKDIDRSSDRTSVAKETPPSVR